MKRTKHEDIEKKIAQKERTLKVVTEMLNKSRVDPKILTKDEKALISEIDNLKRLLVSQKKQIIDTPLKEQEREPQPEIIYDDDEDEDDEDDEVEIIDDEDDEDDEASPLKKQKNVDVEIIDDEDDEDEHPEDTYAQQLLRDGYTVISVYSPEQTKQKREQFHDTLMNKMPEFKHNKTTGEVNTFKGEHYFHKGGFGALGNPSSFHNKFVRNVRMDAMNVAKRIFDRVRTMDPTLKNHKLEQIIDRMRVLRKKADLTAESWHRDTTPLFDKKKGFGAKEDDKIYGGWIAFDGPQKFSAVKQTHKNNRLVPTGFAKLSKEDQGKLTKEKDRIIEEKGEKEWYIYVPPGHMLIFQQEMVHEVEKGDKKNRKEPSYRLFTGWRLTRSENPLMPDQEEFFSKQTVPLIKSSQEADMWPQAAWSTQAAMKTLQEWSEATFDPIFLYNRAVQGGEFAGVTYHIIPRYMYGMYDVARKLAARHVVKAMKSIDEKIPKILADVVELPPDEWKEKWTDEELAQHTGIDDDVIRQFMFPPYSEKEKRIYRPVN